MYILFIFLTTIHIDGVETTMRTQEFVSKEACESAANVTTKKFSVAGQGFGKITTIATAVCADKG